MLEADVIIPVYRPTRRFLELLDMLESQSLPIGKIILINTEKKYFDQLTKGTDFWKKHQKLIVEHITKEEFDHGGTRNFGVSLSKASYFIMMTDDAIPADNRLVERLLAPFEDEKVGMTYARQMPAEESGAIERYTRSFNYPEASCQKSAEDLKEMGIKTFFASNVCAAYRRDIFDGLKGFTDHTIFNEDMIYARGLLNAGYRIAYVADAKVVHSHNYSGREQLERNFDLGVSHADYPQIFSGLSTESEGIRLVKKTCAHLFKIGKPWLVFKLVWQSGCKYLGYFLGKRYKKLPRKVIKKFSMNKGYWK
ncbi:MAG: glycosyltransferase family 2 protein [Lachnospiraceae bacterium]|nr:glycosyltransferase family 2 protein [Lachnospiraceae bacterium]